MNNRVTHFEIPAKNPEKISGFYKDVFNWEISKWNGPMDYWLVMTGDPKSPGIDGGIYIPGKGPVRGIVNTIEVSDIDESVEKVKEGGGKILNEIQEIKGVGRMAYAQDVEGNFFGMMQPDKM